jgi:hypothetical protein
MSDIEREEFEQAFLNQYTDFERFENGEYMDDFLQQSWIGWQASRRAISSCSEIPNSSDPDSRQALEGEPVGTAKRCGYDRDITYCEFEADEVPIGTKLYTHPASAQKEIERLQSRVAELYDLIKYAQVKSGVCMCGDNMQDHNQSSGHSPVDVWDHAVEQVDKGGTSEALILRKQAEAVQAGRQAVESEAVAWLWVVNGHRATVPKDYADELMFRKIGAQL